MIKFRCGTCNQKLGVPDEWAGKRIRCNRCKESCLVPHPPIEPQPLSNPTTAMIPPEPELSSQADPGLGWPSDLTDLQDGTLLPKEPRRPPIPPKTKIPIPEYRISRGDEEPGPSRALSLAKGLGKIPLSIGLAFAFALGVAAAWGGIAVVTGFSINYLAVGVACAAAWGLIALQDDRNVGLGLLAAMIGLVGILCGKYFVAKWAVMPRLQNIVHEQLSQTDWQTLSREQRNELIHDPVVSYNVLCMQLAENGEFSREIAVDLVIMKIRDEVPDDPSPEVVAAREKVDVAVAEWDSSKKMEALRKQYGPLQQAVADRLLDSKVGTVATLAVAFVATFSLFDLMWFPMALWAAFKIANDSDT